MKIYLLSLGTGLLVGVVYSLLNVHSPAPPLVALIGLLGILAGEQIVPLADDLARAGALSQAWRKSDYPQHLFGLLPGHQTAKSNHAETETRS